MQIVIDQDTSPQVIAASLTIGAGQKMSLTVQVPLSYVLAHGAIGQVYIDGIGGRAEAQSMSGDVVTITAHSKIGSTTLDRSRYDPTYAAATSLTAWLDRIAAAVSGGTSYSADGAILDAAPYTHGMAAASPYQLLTTIAGCYGMDIIHYSTDAGDVFKVAQPLSQASGSISIGDLSSLTYDDAIADAETISIVKTAPIQQHDKTVASMGSGIELKRTSQGLPYYDGTIQYNQINRFWDSRTTTISKDEIMQSLDVETVLQDWAQVGSSDAWYKTKFAFSAFFGSWTKQRETKTKDYYDVYYNYRDDQGWLYAWARFVDLPPETNNLMKFEYTHVQEQAQTENYDIYGLLSTTDGTVYAHTESHNETTHYGDEPSHDETTTSDDLIYNGVWSTMPYEFSISGSSVDSSARWERYHRHVSVDQQVTFDLLGGTVGAGQASTTPTQTTAALYPWMPTCRKIKTTQTTSTSQSTGVGENKTTETDEITVTKALFDADWNDLVHPPTIDDDFISLTDVTLPKTTGVWFDATATPVQKYQWMGLGCIGNIRYTAGRGERKITLRPGLQPGRLTARAMSGQVQHFNIQRAFSLYRLGAVAPVNITFIASGEKSFTVPQHQDLNGRVYSITGTVWREPATARACIPYIERQHNPGRRVRFTIPVSVRSISDAIAITGTVQTLASERIYINGFTADYRAGLITYSGRVISEN